MPINLTKTYNQLLEIVALDGFQRKQSLLQVFNRDFVNGGEVKFRNKLVTPTPSNGVINMNTLFGHLTTTMINPSTRQREFEYDRSCRLHWIRYHIEERQVNKILVFSVHEPEGFRTYIYDDDEKYVIVLEPLRNSNEYYLITAYHIKGKDAQRKKMMRKYARRLPNIL